MKAVCAFFVKFSSLISWTLRLPGEEEFFLRLIASVRETVVFPKFEAATRKDLVAIPLEDFIPKRKPGIVIALAQPKAKSTFSDRRAAAGSGTRGRKF